MTFAAWWESYDEFEQSDKPIAEIAYNAGFNSSKLPKTGQTVRILEDDRDWSVIEANNNLVRIEINDLAKLIPLSMLQPKYVIFWGDYKLEGYRKDILELYKMLGAKSDVLIKNLNNGKEVKLQNNFLVEIE
jgi:hypothetical protein